MYNISYVICDAELSEFNTNAEVEVEVEVEDPLPAEVMMALCRVFSGELKRDSNLYLMGSRHSPLTALQNVRTVPYARYFASYMMYDTMLYYRI